MSPRDARISCIRLSIDVVAFESHCPPPSTSQSPPKTVPFWEEGCTLVVFSQTSKRHQHHCTHHHCYHHSVTTSKLASSISIKKTSTNIKKNKEKNIYIISYQQKKCSIICLSHISILHSFCPIKDWDFFNNVSPVVGGH